MEPPTVIETPRLRLLPLGAEDAGDLHPVLDDVRLHRFIGGVPVGSAVALRERFARLQTGAPAGSGETWLNWVVRLCEPAATAVGTGQATVRAETALVAWVIGSDWQRRGYASEAITALVAALLAAGIPAITAHIHPGHVASQRVAGRAGLSRTGRVDGDGEEVWQLTA